MTAPLTERVAVITGGGRGIGRAIARRFASDGVAVVVSSRTESDLDAVVAEAENAGGRGLAVVADALDRDAARLPVQRSFETFGRVDILVNNVGGTLGTDNDPFTGSDETFEKNITLNLISAWWTTRAALPHMRDQNWGRIINIGSSASKWSTPNGWVSYTSAKHGLVGFTRQLARSAAPFGVTVNCVCPGWTNTSYVDWDAVAKRRGQTPDQAKSQALSSNLQHRMLEPEELTGLVSLLASDEGYGITGQVHSVDGGYGI